ncbi:MAG: TrmH family RNA methyltransferase [bacterium]
MHHITIVLENIRSALNVGAIMRTCDAAAVEKLFLLGITPYPPHNKIPKTALGAENSIKWEYIKEYQNFEFLPKQPTLGIEIVKNAKNLFDFNFPKPCTIIFGNEISGISPQMLQICDQIIKIPMYGSKESLNVATSAGIIIYNIINQWHHDQNN